MAVVIGFKTEMVKDFLNLKNMSIDTFCQLCMLEQDEFDLLIDDNNNSDERIELLESVAPIIADLLNVNMGDLFE